MEDSDYLYTEATTWCVFLPQNLLLVLGVNPLYTRWDMGLTITLSAMPDIQVFLLIYFPQFVSLGRCQLKTLGAPDTKYLT